MTRFRRILLLTGMGLLCLSGTSAAQSLDSAFLAGLRERRLFELAEKYCVNKLARPATDETERAELATELIRTLVAHALQAPSSERDALWQRARSVASDFEKDAPRHPRLVQVRLQDALTPLAQGERGRQELEAGMLPADKLEPARQALREAGELLGALDKHLSREIPLRRRSEPQAGELTADRLFSLQQHVQHQLARAARNRALLFPEGSDDRLALLLAAGQTLELTRSQLAADDPLARLVQLDLAEGQRLLGHPDEAARLLAGLNVEGTEAPVRLRARAELLRGAMAQDDAEALARLIAEGRRIDGQSAADLDFALFEAYLWQARTAAAAKDAVAAGKHQDQAAEGARLLESEHGTFWGRRADRLLVAVLPLGAGAMNVELLARTSNSLYLQGDFGGALAALDDAAGQARAAGNLNGAFELAYKGALIEQGRQRHAEAAHRFRMLGKSLATHPQAAQAHLLGAWHAAQVAQTDAAAEYTGILREHLAHWPGQESASQVRLWLGRLAQSRGDFPAAIAAYAAVPRESPQFDAAIAGLADASREHLAQIAAAGKPVSEPADEAVEHLLKVVRDAGDRLPEAWSVADRTAALAAAEMLLAYQPEKADEAEKLLAEAIAGSQGAPAEWLAAARAQLVIAVAQQPDRAAQASGMLAEIGDASPAQLLEVVEGLAQAAGRSDAQARPRIAEVALTAIERLAAVRAALTAGERASLDRLHAQALAAAGRREEAVAAFDRLVEANPQSGTLQVARAELLLAGDDKPSLAAALEQWRVVARRSAPRTERWYQAKYSIALAQFKLGDKAGAATLLRYLTETPPGLKGTAWETPFAELLKRCELVGSKAMRAP